MTARVFVPLVGANGEGAHMFEAIAGDTAPEAHPARLSPQISELFDFGLYGVGQTVREAVARFAAARRERLWLSARNGVTAPWNLRISDLQVGRLSDENARSAGLGLTIAALCQAFGVTPDLVFATGEIMLPNTPGAPKVAIGPVGGVRGKLALVGDYIGQHRQALEGQKLIVVLPRDDVDGRPLAESQASILNRLREEAAGAKAELQFIFAETLDSLEPALGVFALREFVTRRRAVGLVAALAGLVLLAFGAHSVLNAPVTLAFEPLGAASGTADDSSPQRARYDSASDKLRLLGPCYDAQREPLVIGGETLVLKVRASDSMPLASRVRPPRLFIASVSRAADPVLLDAAHFRTVGSGKPETGTTSLTAAIPIEPIEDEVRIFVVATRDPSVDVTSLQVGLRNALKGLSGPAVLTTTATFLADRLGSEIGYQFKVTNDPQACPT